MGDNDGKSYEEGVRDQKIENLQAEVSLLKKIVFGVIGAVIAQWAKLSGLFN